MTEHEALESSVHFPYRFTYFHILKIALILYNSTLCDSNAFLCILSVESVFITGSFHPAICPSPHQPPAGTGGISHRLSPVWTWSQRQPCTTVYVWLFHHLMGSKMSLAPQAGQEVCLVCLLGNHCPTWLQVSLLAHLGCWYFLLTASPPDLKYSLCLVMSSHSLCYMYPCPHHASTLWPQDLYGRTVPLTAATPLPTFSVIATQTHDKIPGHPVLRSSEAEWKRG